MRLLLIIPHIVSYRAFLREVAETLVREGAAVHVACSQDRLFDTPAKRNVRFENGVQFHALPFARGMNPAAHLRAARELRDLVEAVQPDLIHAHFSAAIFTTALARTKSWPRTLGTFHGLSFAALNGWKRPLFRCLETWAAQRCDDLFVLTNDDGTRLRAALRGGSVQTLQSCGVGCDLERFERIAPSQREKMRSELGLRSDNCVFAFVGRFVNFKGFAAVIRAFRHAATLDRSIRLLLIGGPDPLHSTGLTPAEEQGLRASAQIIALGFRDDVHRFLPAADALVFPSRREGFPVCVMEALAMGVPVITRDTRGCRDAVRHEVDGLVLRDCSVKALALAMRRLAFSPELRLRLSEAAYAGRDRFSRAHFIREQQRLYAQLVPKPEEELVCAG